MKNMKKYSLCWLTEIKNIKLTAFIVMLAFVLTIAFGSGMVLAKDDPFPEISQLIKKWQFADAFALVTEKLNSQTDLATSEVTYLNSKLGIILKMLGRDQDALAHFNEIIKVDETSETALYFLSILYMSSGNFDNARAYCEKLKKLNPKNYRAYVISAVIYSAELNINKAYAEARKAFDLNDESFEANAIIYNYYKKTKKYDQARDRLKKLLKLTPDLENAPFFNIKNFRDKSAAFDRVKAEVLYEYGILTYNYFKQPKIAQKYYNESIKLYSEIVAPKIASAQCHLLFGHIDEAQKLLCDVIAIDNANKIALDVLSKIKNNDKFDDFINLNLDTMQPENIAKLVKYCQNCGKSNKLSQKYCIYCGKIIKSPEKRVKYDQENTAPNNERSIKPETASKNEDTVSNALVTPESEYDKYFEEGMFNLENQAYESAEINFRQIIKLMPKSPEGYNFLGITYLARANYEEAVKNFEKSVSMNPDFAEGYFSLGKVYEIQKKYSKAFSMYEKAIKINSEYDEAKAARERLKNRN